MNGRPLEEPTDQDSHPSDPYFTDSPTRGLLTVIGACLRNFYDVPRAKQIFERSRKSSKAEAVMNTRLYGSLLEEFIAMTTSKDPIGRLVWLEGSWVLFDSMERGMDVAVPNATTCVFMLAA